MRRGGLSADVGAILDRRLNAPDAAPVAVAVSGGGDSLALLHLAKAWADRAGRALRVLTVDHGLNAQSAGWADFVIDRAHRLGLEARVLPWTGEKPRAGLPAAARAARHALLARAARDLGARVVLMGHTADDLAEAAAMRAAGAPVASPREWAASPAWPEGRGVFLLRPLLGVRRAALRAWLGRRGETWIDDPANDDPRFARSRARRRLAADPGCTAPAPPDRLCAGLVDVCEGLAGELTAPRAVAADGRLLGAMLLCASGGATPPRGARLAALQARLAGADDVVATLAGARIEARGAAMLICREAGERARGGLAASVGDEIVFDGRILIERSAAAGDIRPLAGLATRLPSAQRQALRAVPPAARGALPAIVSPSGDVTCPILAQAARPLSLQRLHAAVGAIGDEAALWCVAKSQPGA